MQTKQRPQPSSHLCNAANQAELQVLSHRAAQDQALKEFEAVTTSNPGPSTSISTTAKRKCPSASVEDAIKDDDVEFIEEQSEPAGTSVTPYILSLRLMNV